MKTDFQKLIDDAREAEHKLKKFIEPVNVSELTISTVVNSNGFAQVNLQEDGKLFPLTPAECQAVYNHLHKLGFRQTPECL